jgi:serine/threonine protein kinase
LASPANVYPPDPLGAAATEPTARPAEPSEGGIQTRIDTTAQVIEVPVRAYGNYEPGVVVAQKYQLVRILGEGGMGSVWVAKNLALDVHVALKLIRAELAHSVPGLGERLLQEARAAASIEHPAVIQVFDFGLTELRDPFIAMELLHGESLAGTIKRRGKVNPVRAVQTLLPIVDALFAAHERGIVHRDLKPDNIFLARGAGDRLEPKVLDFGIAKFDQKVSSNLTSAGTVLGSPAYMSPEQARGETDVDCRTDVWALCVVLYEAITGQLPFAGENYNALLYAILEGQPRTFSELSINEPLLWSILSRGLEKQRAHRCPNMFELGRALAIWLLDRGVQEDVCNALLKPKWLERKQHKAASGRNSFFPTDPPVSGQPHTMRSEEGQAELIPLDENGELSSGVLLRPADVTTNQLFGVPYSGKTGTGTQPLAPRAEDRRWLWLMLAGTGALLSFSVAVGWQAWSNGRSHDDDDDVPIVHNEAPRRSARIAAETEVGSVVEIKRPVIVPREILAPQPLPAPLPRRTPTVADARPEPRPSEARPKPAARSWDAKAARSDLKNPFR